MIGSGRARLRLRAAASVVKPMGARAWRSELSRRAVDETADAARRSCLVLAPHPDDETLGAGALIARKRAAGTRVRVLVITDGRDSHRSSIVDADALAVVRREESMRACASLGVPVDDVLHLGLREGTVRARFAEVVAKVVDHIESLQPEDVLVTSGWDWHLDHQACADVARAALRHTPGPRLLEYPVWCWADGPWSGRPGRTAWRATRDLFVEPVATARAAHPVRVGTEPQHLGAKRAALAAYASQTTNLTGEPDWAVMEQAFLDLFLRDEEIFFRSAETPATPVQRSVT